MHLITQYLLHYGNIVVFMAVLLEDFGMPLPGEIALIAAGILAGTGRFNIALILLLAFLGAVIGDNIGYAIGYFGGRPLALRYGKYVFLKEERLAAVERFFQKYGDKIVTVARFFSGLRQLNGIIAGIGKMPWWRFLAFNTLGAALWTGVWGLAAYFFGRKSGDILTAVKQLELVVLPLLVAGVVIFVFSRRHRRPAG